MMVPAHYRTFTNIPFLLQEVTGRDFAADQLFHIHRMGRIGRTIGSVPMQPHRTAFYGLVLIEDGRGSMTIDGTTIPYQPGTICLTSPGQLISYEFSAISDGFTLFFQPEFLGELAGSMKKSCPNIGFNKTTTWAVGPEFQGYRQLCESLVHEYQEQEHGHEDVKRGYLLVLLALLNRLAATSADKQRKPINRRSFDITEKFERLIRQHLPERLSLSRYAEHLCVSKKHLIELVKQATGKTPFGLIQEIFLLEAKLMLLHSFYSVAEIAFQLNFTDPSHFNKVFKKRFGVSASALRKQQVN